MRQIKTYLRAYLFYLDDSTLKKWADKTLEERAVLFHRSYPEVKIHPSYICRIYKKYRIKRKAIVQVKCLPGSRSEKMTAHFLMMKSELQKAQ